MPRRAATARWSLGALGIVLLLGLGLRVILAYLLPGSGFGVDLTSFHYWAANLAKLGPNGFYNRDFFADYTPGYLYVLWFVGWLHTLPAWNAIGEAVAWLANFDYKVPSILADLAIGWIVHRMVLELGGSKRHALLGAALFVFNPISWFDSTVWGQVDSFGVVFLLLGVRELWHDHPERASILAMTAAVIKPQLGILIPILAAVILRRYLIDPLVARRHLAEEEAAADGVPADRLPADDLRADGLPADDRPSGDRGPVGMFRAWGRRERGPTRVLTSGLAGLATAVALSLPFGLTIVDLFRRVLETAGGYPYLTVNAYNPWALLTQGANGIAADGLWVRDVTGPKADEVGFYFGPIPAVVVGSILLLLVVTVVAVIVARRPDRLTILTGLTVLAIAFFVVPTRVHERYMFPFFALGAIFAAVSTRWRVAYVALSIATFANMYVVLTTLYPDNPSISDWLGLGPDIRSMTSVTIIALVHLAGLLWALGQLRVGAEVGLLDEIRQGAWRVVAATAGVGGNRRPLPGPGSLPGAGAAAATLQGDAAAMAIPSELEWQPDVASSAAERGPASPRAPTIEASGHPSAGRSSGGPCGRTGRWRCRWNPAAVSRASTCGSWS